MGMVSTGLQGQCAEQYLGKTHACSLSLMENGGNYVENYPVGKAGSMEEGKKTQKTKEDKKTEPNQFYKYWVRKKENQENFPQSGSNGYLE